MLADRWKRVAELFESALDLPAERRADWLRSASGDDTELLSIVSRMLDEHERVERSRFLIGAPAARPPR